MKKIKLSNGVEIPQLGYGVYQVEPDECERCVLDALSVGYRMIDTAQAYLNEELFTNPTLTQIGEKYGKTAAQVALRWLLQSDVVIIPKTVHKERMKENLDLFDFKLDADDMQRIAALDTAHSLFLDHHSGETTKQFMEWRAVVKPTE